MGKKIMTGFPTREKALTDFFREWVPERAEELVSLNDSIGRILARDLFSSVTLPICRSSACDGIAVRSSDFVNGLPDTSSWQPGINYVRADTGDDFPDAYDAVIMIEKARIQPDGSVILDGDVQVSSGTNVNPAGSTVSAKQLLLPVGHLIRPTDVAALCMGGISVVPVRKKPLVAFIPTGNELVAAGVHPQRGEMIESNALMVTRMLEQYGADTLAFPIVRDDPSALEAAFTEALHVADVVVINGGSAVGSEDFNVRMIEKCGYVIHHYIAAAPGRPLMMAVAAGKPVIDLPGPMIAAFYGTDWCLQAIVKRILDIPMTRRQTITATVATPAGAHPSIAMLQRWNVTRTDAGYVARYCNFQKGETAAALTSNALRVSPLGEKNLEIGQQIKLELLEGIEFIASDATTATGFTLPFDDESQAVGPHTAVGLHATMNTDIQTTEIPANAGETGDFSAVRIVDTLRCTNKENRREYR